MGRPLTPLDPDGSHAARLGAEIRSRRLARGLTLERLGRQIGFSGQHLSEAERGSGSVSEVFVAACDRALDAEGQLLALLPAVILERAAKRHGNQARRQRSRVRRSSASRGDASHAADPAIDRLTPTDRAVAAIRGALMSREVFAPDPTGRPPNLDVLRRHIASGWCTFQSSQYSVLADRFPAILRHGQLAAQRHEGRERLAAAGLLSMLYQHATLALLKLGGVDAAWLAADRAVAAAEESGHYLVLGSAGRMLAYVFLDAGECEKAQQLGLAAAAALERKPEAGASRLSVLGALYLKTAVAAARQGDRSTAIDLLTSADRAAGQLDTDLAPEEVRLRPTTRALISDILHRAPVIRRDLRELAHRLAVA